MGVGKSSSSVPSWALCNSTIVFPKALFKHEMISKSCWTQNAPANLKSEQPKTPDGVEDGQIEMPKP